MLFLVTTMKLQLPVGLLSSICFIETNHNPHAMHYNDGSSNSVGICQIKLIAARQVGYKGTELDLLDPNTNILYAGKYLKYQLRRYNGNVTKAVVAYNKGHAGGTQTAYQLKVFKQWMTANR